MKKLLLTLMVVCVAATSSWADIRIKFARGRTSATVTGRVANGGRVCYVAGARRGQTLTATLSSATGKVQIFESGDTSYSAEVEQSGDQSICVDNLGKATSYTLTVSIR
jgi:hypothetical protein